MAQLSKRLREQANRYRQIANDASDPEAAEALLDIVDELETALGAIEDNCELEGVVSSAVH